MKTFIKNNILNFYILIFLIISFISISKASLYLSSTLGNLYFKQVIWFLVGFIFILFIRRIKIKKFYNISLYLYLLNNIFLAGLFLFGKEINSSKAWYSIFNVNLQPSELMKISLILLNSYVIYKFYKNKSTLKKKEEFKLILTLLFILIVPSILTFLEPDTGAVICYFVITFSMLYISGIDKRWFYLFFAVLFLGIIFFLYLFYFDQTKFISIFGTSFFYRIERILDWGSKSGMQLNNSLIAIGSSGLTGHSEIPIYYPEAGTDFIFTSYSSTYGLVGSIVLLIILFSFDLYLLKITKKLVNKQNKYTLFGIFSLFFYQQVQNIAMTMGLLPITGITLPLISYGGSSVLCFLILIGIVESILKEKKA